MLNPYTHGDNITLLAAANAFNAHIHLYSHQGCEYDVDIQAPKQKRTFLITFSPGHYNTVDTALRL